MVHWEDFGLVLVYSLGSLVWLFVLTKLMGNRQMSQLTLFDYIIGISIGSIAAEMASHPEEDAWLGLIAMTIYALVAVGFNVLNDKSLKARRVLIGSPLVLLDHGQLYRQNLKRAKLDLNELLAECRSAGYFDLSELEMILMEVNGKLSFLPVSQNRPVTPQDLSLAPAQDRPAVAVVMDGVPFPERLKAVGLDEAWLQKQLKNQRIDDCRDVFFASVDRDQSAFRVPAGNGRPQQGSLRLIVPVDAQPVQLFLGRGVDEHRLQRAPVNEHAPCRRRVGAALFEGFFHVRSVLRTAAGDQGNGQLLCHGTDQLQVVALHRAVPVDGVEQNFPRAQLLRPPGRFLRRLPGGNGSVLGETAVTLEKILLHIQRNGHALSAETLEMRVISSGFSKKAVLRMTFSNPM